jgi:hypothetical protein
MDIQGRPIRERIDWLFDVARRHSATFAAPESYLARRRYLSEHPTAVMVLKCMDGRINIPVATRTPTGIIQPFRNLGGMFDLGWPHLGEVLTNHVQGVVSAGRRALMLITYHFSRGDPRRGRAGFDYNTDAAIEHTYGIKRQVEHVFGAGHGTVYPIVCGFETDEDALTLHGPDGGQLNAGEPGSADGGTLYPRLRALFPDMPAQVCEDILPLIVGNIEHIAAVRGAPRELDIEHREWVICIGRGFDFLHMPNQALIVGPYSPNLDDPVRKAAVIIRDNMAARRIPDDGFLLLASSPYDEVGVDRARAELKSRFLCQFAAGVIRAEFPALAARMHVRTAVLDWASRSLQVLPEAETRRLD